MTRTASVYVELYHCHERDLWDVIVHGSEDWDVLRDLPEQEAIDEAEAIAAEIQAPVVRT